VEGGEVDVQPARGQRGIETEDALILHWVRV